MAEGENLTRYVVFGTRQWAGDRNGFQSLVVEAPDAERALDVARAADRGTLLEGTFRALLAVTAADLHELAASVPSAALDRRHRWPVEEVLSEERGR